MGSAMSSDELMSPPHLKDVLKTLEYFGIYQRFECIKCHQEFATINLALAHLRGEYLECKKIERERTGEKEVSNSLKEAPLISSTKKKGKKK